MSLARLGGTGSSCVQIRGTNMEEDESLRRASWLGEGAFLRSLNVI